jgi:hypothetical protein
MKTTALQSRIDRLEARISDSVCPSTIASLVRSMTRELDPEAMPALVRLLGHKHDARDSVRRALRRYGDHAEDSLRAAPTDCIAARYLLDELAVRARLQQVGCF